MDEALDKAGEGLQTLNKKLETPKAFILKESSIIMKKRYKIRYNLNTLFHFIFYKS